MYAYALGVFDGLHLAHQAVLRGAKTLAERLGLRPAALLFERHPEELLLGSAPAQLMTDEARDKLLTEQGFALVKLPFASVMHNEPARFFHTVLLRQLNAAALCCGYHYRFGEHAAGGAAQLRRLCVQSGIPLSVVPRMDYQGEPISSTRVRAALADGQCALAAAMLGRPFGYAFVVERGAQLGRKLGAPTLNQSFPAGFCVPKRGVYTSETSVDGQWLPSITNIGCRPTLQDSQLLRSETHILRFEGDLYGRTTPVRLLRFQREEQPFASLEELARQIREDVLRAAAAP
jgi:riboflavin kinase/FMN adenylyltransferase